MAYFTVEFIEFFRALARHNDREWYRAHKRDFERHVKEPFHDFVEEMIHRVRAIDSDVSIEAGDAIFRLARDIRFSKDKTPYKTFTSAVISPSGRKDVQYPGLYFQFGADGAGIASGVYMPSRENLDRIRRAILRDGKRLARLLEGKRFKETFGELRGERNKRVPKPFAAAQERYPFIANKQFYYWAQYDDPAVILRADLADFVMRHYRVAHKVNDFWRAALRGDAR